MGSHIPKASLDGENRWVYLHDTPPIPLKTVFDTRDRVICAPTVDRFTISTNFIVAALLVDLKAHHTTRETFFVYFALRVGFQTNTALARDPGPRVQQ